MRQIPKWVARHGSLDLVHEFHSRCLMCTILLKSQKLYEVCDLCVVVYLLAFNICFWWLPAADSIT